MRGLCLAFVIFACGCGGSSSETPPPLEPDPRNLYRGTGAPFLQKQRPAQPAEEREDGEGEEDERKKPSGKPARSTWGDPTSRELK